MRRRLKSGRWHSTRGNSESKIFAERRDRGSRRRPARICELDFFASERAPRSASKKARMGIDRSSVSGSKSKLRQTECRRRKAESHFGGILPPADDAEGKLNLRKDARPSPYPTAEEISDWEKACQKLEAELESRRAKVRDGNARRQQLTGELIVARNQFTNLMFRERNLRPRETVPAYAGIELAGVK